MADYKQPCRHCGVFLPRDSRFCPKCGSAAPFMDLCPSCLGEIHREDGVCAHCGRPLYISCPHCKEQTFVTDKCDRCSGSLMIPCKNPRCGEMQFFQNSHCTGCGKRLG